MSEILNIELKLKHGLGQNSAVPNAIARSAIFSSQIFRGIIERPLVTTPLKIPALNGLEVFQTSGRRLDQGDADVFYEIARLHLLGTSSPSEPDWVRTLRADLITSIGKSKGGKTNVLLSESLTRLSEAKFSVRYKDGEYSDFGLLKNLSMEMPQDQNCTIHLQIDEALSQHYRSHGWALLRKSVRKHLRSPISKWFYAYYCSHSNNPYHLLANTVKEHVDRIGSPETNWLVRLRNALDELKKATDWEKCDLVDNRKVVVIKKKGMLGKPTGKQAPALSASCDDYCDI